MIDQSVDNKNLSDDKLILVGVISKAHGIKGQIVIKSYTAPPENIVNLPVFDQDKNPFKFKTSRIQPNGNLICTIKNCDSRNAAESFVKKTLYCYRSDLPQIASENEFYIEDLIGLKLVDLQGHQIGKIVNIVNYGAGDIIEVKFTKDKDSRFEPFTKELFPEIHKDYVVWGGV